VVRLADAAGADGVIMAGDAVDPFGPKAVRASAGSVFHLPVVRAVDPLALLADLTAAGLSVLATTASAELDLDAAAASILDLPTAWLFGSEAHGLPVDVIAAADAAVRVPIHGRAESLNLATAAAICLYASASAHRRCP
jgi:TrmH family RNA methyltransferase